MLVQSMSGSPYAHTDAELLRRISRSAGSKAGYKQLVRELGLGGGRARRLLLEQLTRMVARGALRLLEDQLWALPTPVNAGGTEGARDKSTSYPAQVIFRGAQATPSRGTRDSLTSGRLEVHRDGFGFVRADVALSKAPASTATSDIFIPPNALHGAMHGDLVLVEEDAPGRDGRRSGRVARVLTRRNQTTVGVFHYGHLRARRSWSDDVSERRATDAENYVQPWDERLGGPIFIPAGAETPPAAPESPHRTLGEEAQRTSRVKAKVEDPESEGREFGTVDRWPLEGLAVEVEITRFAQPGRPAMGRILEVLGPPDAFGVDVEIVVRKHSLPHTFPAHVLAEADRSARETVASLTQEDLAEREDFRGLPVVTIDGETARDFDDAVLVRSLANGNTELQVHIADVSHYVQAGSAVDIEARVRGTSVYFPDRAVPMLPHALSSGVCSLLPEQDRMVLSCIMEIDAHGEVAGYRVAEGLIRSVRRLTYTAVQHCLNASPEAAAWNADRALTPEPNAADHAERERLGLLQPELPSLIGRMLELAIRLNRKRVRRGSIDFDLPEPVVEFDPDGNMKAIVRSERGWAHRLIEEFMLSANECVATWLTAQGTPSIYRIHEMPDPKRIVDFEETAATFGETLGIGALPVRRLALKGDRREAQRRSSRGHGGPSAPVREIPERIPVTPQMYQRLVRRITGKPEERILSYLMLRSLKQARYAEKNEGHFALASPCYTHFTSPIRRYPDLIVHRLVRAMLRQGADPQGGPLLSTDPQPWAAEQERAQGRHPAAAHALSPLRSSRAPQEALDEAAPLRASSRQGPRDGRIGWSGNDAGEGQPSRAEHNKGIAKAARHAPPEPVGEPFSAAELADIAVESSQAERRAADAERELVEWKKMKFMADKVGDNFTGLILSITKFGFFVELDELFVEGLVPLGSLMGDVYHFRDADRVLCGARTGHCFRVGDRVAVILDRIDRQQRRLQFALDPGTEPRALAASSRKGNGAAESRGPKSKKARKVQKKAKAAKRHKR